MSATPENTPAMLGRDVCKTFRRDTGEVERGLGGAAVSEGVVRYSDVRRELPGRVFGELPGDTGVAVVKGSGGSGGEDRAQLIVEKCGHAEDLGAGETVSGVVWARPAQQHLGDRRPRRWFNQ